MKNITLMTILSTFSLFGFTSLTFAVATPTMPNTSSTTSGIVFPSAPPRPIMPLPSNGICPVDCICYPATTTTPTIPGTTTGTSTPGRTSETTGIFSAGFGNIISGTVGSPGGGGGGGTIGGSSGGGGIGGGAFPSGGTVLGTQTFNPSGVPVEGLGGVGDGGLPEMPNTALGDERDLFYLLLLIIVALIEGPFLITKLAKRLKIRNAIQIFI
jgi:hypothetical protein